MPEPPPPELIATLERLAAAVGCPVVALFGPSDPSIWAPRGECVRVVTPPRPGMPMDAISLAAVQEAVVSLGVA